MTKKRKSLKRVKANKKTALCKPTNNKLTNGLLFALVHNYNQNINQQELNIKRAKQNKKNRKRELL